MNRMAYYRKKAGLSIGQLARSLRLSNTTISLAELGHMHPYPRLRKRISDLLNVPECEIFDEKGWVRTDEVNDS
jgi:transcriptional regulator with XRE-family HTH domain